MASINPIITGNTGGIKEAKPSIVVLTPMSSHALFSIISVRTYQSFIDLNVGNIVETKPLDVTCTTTGSHSVSNNIYILF